MEVNKLNKTKNLKTGYALAFFLGIFGAHLFYYEKYIRAFFYLLFSWTFIPIILGWIDMLFIKRWNEEINEVTLIKTGIHSVKDKPKNILSESLKNRLFPILSNNKSDNNPSHDLFKDVKDALIYYNEKDIILPQYEHIQTPDYILESLKESLSASQAERYNTENFTFEVRMNQPSIEFLKQSKKHSKKRGQHTKEVPFQAYWPTFSDLNNRQLKWYFYWREQVLKQNYIDIDLSYIFLFVYELLNYSFNDKAAFNISMLVLLLDNYKDRHPKLSKYLEEWIADMLLEVGEDKLASEWDTRAVSYPTLYDELKSPKTSINDISMSVWKKYLYNYRETKFFNNNKTKIYKKFKQGMRILQDTAADENRELLNEWFEVKDIRIIKNLYNKAVMGRRCDPVHKYIKQCNPTDELKQVVTNLLRQAENTVRIENDIKREIKVDETVLPNNLKEEMLKKSARFKVVSEKHGSIQGSNIPQPPKTRNKDTGISFNWEEINKKEKELDQLQNQIEDYAINEEKRNPVPSNNHLENNSVLNAGNLSQRKDNEDNEDNNNILDNVFNDEEVDHEEFIDSLIKAEKEFILLFNDGVLSREKAKKFLKQQGLMLGMFLTDINEKANKDLGDILFKETEESIIILEEFKNIVNVIRSERVEN